MNTDQLKVLEILKELFTRRVEKKNSVCLISIDDKEEIDELIDRLIAIEIERRRKSKQEESILSIASGTWHNKKEDVS